MQPDKPHQQQVANFDSGLNQAVGLAIAMEPRCYFFYKLGVCRYGPSCPKGHFIPNQSPVIALPMMYPNPRMVPLNKLVKGQRIEADYDLSWLRKHQETFFEDLFTTLGQFGLIHDMMLLENLCEHMLGYVFVRYDDHESAGSALKGLRGQMYNGVLLLPDYSHISIFDAVVCYDQAGNSSGTCVRGLHCNFWHPTPFPRRDGPLVTRLRTEQLQQWRGKLMASMKGPFTEEPKAQTTDVLDPSRRWKKQQQKEANNQHHSLTTEESLESNKPLNQSQHDSTKKDSSFDQQTSPGSLQRQNQSELSNNKSSPMSSPMNRQQQRPSLTAGRLICTVCGEMGHDPSECTLTDL